MCVRAGFMATSYSVASSLKAWPLPEDCIHFVDSVHSEQFSTLLSALDRSFLVAMDAEWKPHRTRKAGFSYPRVSIMQIACRLRSDEDIEEEMLSPRSVSCELAEQRPLSDSNAPGSDDDKKAELLCQDNSISGRNHHDESDQDELPPDNDEARHPDIHTVLSFNSNGEVADCMDEAEEQGDAAGNGDVNPCSDYGNESKEMGISKELAEQCDIDTRLTVNYVDREKIVEQLNCSIHTEKPLDSSPATDQRGARSVESNLRIQDLLAQSLQNLEDKKEMVFVLDMMSLPAWSFWESMKRMLVSPKILKLGFKFKQDLINLAHSFPGPDAHSCFDKADPYVDVGRLYNELQRNSSGLIAFGQTISSESLSLAMVCEQVLGYTLSKDLQCSDWEQRPLTLEQKLYAAADAHCLLVIYDVLETVASVWEFKGNEIASDCSWTNPTHGIAELLLNDAFNTLNGCVVHAYRGTAMKMVQAASSKGDACRSSGPHMLVAKKFGERLLVNGEGNFKAVKRKPRTRRGRENLGNKGDRQELHSWSGPPPWDPLYGGDGCPKFICDVMVEGLARQLRNVGIDTLCPHVRKSDPRKLSEIAEKEGRVLLTRDIKLLRRRLFPQNLAYRVQSLGKQDQLAEVVKTFNLTISEENLLSRCTKCNGSFIPEPLSPNKAVAAAPKCQTIPDYAITERLLFWQCSDCRHMYWQGNQFHRALESFQAFARRIQVEASQ